MKIITWNANMAFRKKAHLLMPYQPDILVIPECEHPGRLNFSDSSITPTDVIWHGHNQSKGLAVLSFGNYRLTLIDGHNADLRTILPVKVANGEEELMLFAVWANNPLDKANQYVGQIWKALHCYDMIIKNTATILAGDFNSNTIWDKPRREGNHSTVVERLMAKGITSAYHHHFKQTQGTEEHATFSLYKHKHRPYHLDYCFASADLVDRLISVEIGTHEEWYMYSDHYPVIVGFK